MFSRSRSQRRSEIDFVLRFEEMKRQEYKFAARQKAPIKALERVHTIDIDDRHETCEQQCSNNECCLGLKQGDSVQQEIVEQRLLDVKIRNDIREFLEERAEQRRLYQVNKNKALLAEFLEQRAHARRAYREAKARSEMATNSQLPQHGKQQEGSDSPDLTQMPTANGMQPHTGLRGIEIESGTATKPAHRRAGVIKRVQY
jgi:hypothetical protein